MQMTTNPASFAVGDRVQVYRQPHRATIATIHRRASGSHSYVVVRKGRRSLVPHDAITAGFRAINAEVLPAEAPP